MQPFTDKVTLEPDEAHPLCPWCETPLARIHWHKIRGGPALLHYVAVLSCAACRGVLDVLEGGSGNGVAGVA